MHKLKTDAVVSVSESLRLQTQQWSPQRSDLIVYRPLEYAWDVHQDYLLRYGGTTKRFLFVGMNPGPFGMGQTGVPFGDVSWVKNWLGLKGAIMRPANEHPARPVEGWACSRSEVSGQRLWGWLAGRYASADAWSQEAFVWNYCPLLILEPSGPLQTQLRNFTPDRLPRAETRELWDSCDRALGELIRLWEVQTLVGIGNFAWDRCRQWSDRCELLKLPHPSPASPLSQRGHWADLADGVLPCQ